LRYDTNYIFKTKRSRKITLFFSLATASLSVTSTGGI
jgi:hypothetical protein